MKDWKKLFWDVKLDRGWDYYLDNCVRDLKQTDYGYEAVVEGTEEYEVRIYSNDGIHVDDMECECPDYYEGHNCKHLAAMLYELEDFQKNSQVKTVKKQSSNDEIIAIIDSLSEQQVKDYLKKVIAYDYIARDFKMTYIDKFEDSGLKDEIFDYYYQFKDIYNEYYYEDEFDYDAFTDVSDEFMKRIRNLIEHKHLSEAFECIKTAIKGIEETNIDDGFEYDIWYDYAYLVIEIIEQNDNEFNQELFTWALNELEQIDYEVLAEMIFDELVNQEQYFQQALKWCDIQLNKDEIHDFVLKFKYSSLSKEEKQAFVKKYHSYRVVKELYLTDLLDNQDYLEAIVILKELREDNYTFRSSEYTKKIIELYQKLKMNKEAINEGMNYLYQSVNLTRYKELKEICGENWLDYRDEVFSQLKKVNISMLEYYNAENMIDELYQEAKNNYHSLYQYRNVLKAKYSQELTKATIDYIFDQSKTVGSSNKYYEIAVKIKSLLEYGNDQSLVNDVANKLCLKYPRRRTFIKILNGVVK